VDGGDGGGAFFHEFGALVGLLPGVIRALGGGCGVFGHFQDGGVHLFDGRGHLGGAGALFLHGLGGPPDRGGHLFRRLGQTFGHGRGIAHALGDTVVLIGNGAFLVDHVGEVGHRHEPADEPAVKIQHRGGIDADEFELAFFRREFGLGRLFGFLPDGLDRHGFPVIAVEEPGKGCADERFDFAVVFRQPDHGAVEPFDDVLFVHDGHGRHDILQHGFVPAQAFLDGAFHRGQGLPQGGQVQEGVFLDIGLERVVADGIEDLGESGRGGLDAPVGPDQGQRADEERRGGQDDDRRRGPHNGAGEQQSQNQSEKQGQGKRFHTTSRHP